MHQKRVIDDVRIALHTHAGFCTDMVQVLTLSKLDSNLILITPMRVQPAEEVGNAVKMFEVESHQAGIKLEFRIDETFKGMENCMLDPSRLLQVLINLLFVHFILVHKHCMH
jgi:signal transduction histidine kinase